MKIHACKYRYPGICWFAVKYSEEVCMKGNEKIIEHLNALLAAELTAINQSMVHAEMCDN